MGPRTHFTTPTPLWLPTWRTSLSAATDPRGPRWSRSVITRMEGWRSDGSPVTAQAVESEIVLENLESCQEYEVSVTAILGEEYSDEAKMTFMTNPDPEVADRLQPVIEA